MAIGRMRTIPDPVMFRYICARRSIRDLGLLSSRLVRKILARTAMIGLNDPQGSSWLSFSGRITVVPRHIGDGRSLLSTRPGRGD